MYFLPLPVFKHPQVAPHILIHWRPDDSQYKAFLTRKAPVGAKVDTNAALEMSVLPSVKGLGDNIKPFTVWHTTKQDDSDLMSFLCGPVVSGVTAVRDCMFSNQTMMCVAR